MLRKPNELSRRVEKKKKKVLKILAMDRLMPYGHGGDYWGRPVRDGCMQMPNGARAATGTRAGAGVLEWSPPPP